MVIETEIGDPSRRGVLRATGPVPSLAAARFAESLPGVERPGDEVERPRKRAPG